MATIVLSSTDATTVATTVPTAIAATCCSPCATDRYTVDSTRTTATQGATNAIGAWSHQPATAHAIQAASAALPACATRSRSRPGADHAHRTVRTAAPPRRRTARTVLPIHPMTHQVPRGGRYAPADRDFMAWIGPVRRSPWRGRHQGGHARRASTARHGTDVPRREEHRRKAHLAVQARTARTAGLRRAHPALRLGQATAARPGGRHAHRAALPGGPVPRAGKLRDKVALITGDDSGIGRAVALLHAREGADVAVVHLPDERVGGEAPLGRAAQPEEIAPTYVYLASDADSSCTVGEVIAVTGGIVDTR